MRTQYFYFEGSIAMDVLITCFSRLKPLFRSIVNNKRE